MHKSKQRTCASFFAFCWWCRLWQHWWCTACNYAHIIAWKATDSACVGVTLPPSAAGRENVQFLAFGERQVSVFGALPVIERNSVLGVGQLVHIVGGKETVSTVV